MRLNNKASLEISIQAIVIVVLAMTLLGLGLGFIKGLFKDIGGTTTAVSAQIKEQIEGSLRRSDEKISFPSSQIAMNRGDSQVLGVGIKNQYGSALSYKLGFTILSVPDNHGTRAAVPADQTEVEGWFQFGKGITYVLNPVEIDVRNIKLDLPKGATPGSYFMTFDVSECYDSGAGVIKCDRSYAKKDIFIVVNG